MPFISSQSWIQRWDSHAWQQFGDFGNPWKCVGAIWKQIIPSSGRCQLCWHLQDSHGNSHPGWHQTHPDLNLVTFEYPTYILSLFFSGYSSSCNGNGIGKSFGNHIPIFPWRNLVGIQKFQTPKFLLKQVWICLWPFHESFEDLVKVIKREFLESWILFPRNLRTTLLPCFTLFGDFFPGNDGILGLCYCSTVEMDSQAWIVLILSSSAGREEKLGMVPLGVFSIHPGTDP